ncbi:MAG TPA: rhodanese-like domain-containing protein [Paracoccaceae bacterium]|nr:rhodanese-like domain-containing protein [Paracoccaceae bacterium]
MKFTSLATALATVLALSSPALAQLGPLVTPAELSQALTANAPLVIDIRAPKAPEGQPNENTFTAGHIAGAVNAPYGAFRGPEANPGAVPDAAKLTEVLRGIGVTADRPVVIVHQGRDETDFGAAARVYWTLKSSGVSQLSILNGGVNAWTAAGLPLSTTPVAPTPSTFEVTFSDRWMATTDQVKAIVDGGDKALLLDARPEAFWAGDTAHPAAARPGTLPQSRYFEHSGWFGGGAAVIDAAAARDLATQQGFTGNEQLVSFCNTGHWAATNWFALSELAQIENVKLYPDSMVGWSNAGHEMDNVPGAMRNLWNQVKGIF